MRLKSYHSATVESAIRLAHIELGDEAVFLGSRRNDVGSDPSQAYEVTFAVMGIEDTERDTASRGTLSRNTAMRNTASAGRSPAAAGVARAPGGRTGAPASHTAPHTVPSTAPRAAPRPPDKPARAFVAKAAVTGAAAAAVGGGAGVGGPRSAGNTAAMSRLGNGLAGAGTAAGNGTAAASSATTAANRAAAGDAAQAGGSGIVSWKKFLRHVSHPDAAGASVADSEAPEAHTQRAEESDAAGQNGGSARTGASVRNSTAVRNGGSVHNAPMPHWREFVPGSERGTDAPQGAFLADASRVVQAGDPRSAPKQPQSASGAASRSGDAAHGAAIRPASKPRGMPPARERTSEVYSLQKLGAELEELRRMFERQQAGRTPLVLPSRELLNDTRLAAFYRRLSDNSVEPTLASELVASLQQAAAGGADARRLGALLAEETRKRFTTHSELGRPGASMAIAALVGPSGAGKTTAVAKLAFRCGLLRRRRVRLLSVDPLRMGAVESLQAYAELMNLPFEIVDDFERLGAALREAGQGSEQELLLLDTPGYGRREWERAQRLAAALNECGAVDVHLVLDLRTKSDDLRRTVDNFRLFRPAKLLFTRLDETTTFGTMLNETVRTGLPVSFVSVGQRVPEDIVLAGEPELLRLLLKDRATN